MKTLLYRINTITARFMQGRYGLDELSKMLMISSVFFLMVFYVSGRGFFYYVAVFALLVSSLRCFSKRVDKRNKERNAYLKKRDHFRYKRKMRRKMWEERKTHKYIRCQRCQQYYRVPRGKGSILATCPRCKEKMKVNC